MKKIFYKILSMGDTPDNTDQEKLQHHFLVTMALLMSLGGIFWGSITVYFNIYVAAVSPFAYVILTFLNLIIFGIFKNFNFARFNQVFLSLILPFSLQWTLGGFVLSGAVMLWAMIALLGASTFQSLKLNFRWLLAYLFLTIISGLIDSKVKQYGIQISYEYTVYLFVVNIFSISAIVFGLYMFFMDKKNAMEAAIIRAEQERSEMSRKLAKYLSPQVYNDIFSGKKDVKLESYRKKLTIFFSDIKNFTQITDSIESESLTSLLNEYLNEMSQIAIRHGGTIDKYIGDAIMIFFGDPESRGDTEDAIACVRMAIEMKNAMEKLRKKWANQGISTPLHIRMGINTGFCTVGNFGSEERLDYTIIGGQVNLASRLESIAGEDTILISFETYSLVKDHIHCEKRRVYQVKGIARPVRTFEAMYIIDEKTKKQKEIAKSIPGMDVQINLNDINTESAVQELSLLVEQIKSLK